MVDFDLRATSYNQQKWAMDKGFRDFICDNIIKHGPYEFALDLGTGTGIIPQILSNLSPWLTIGIDINRAMMMNAYKAHNILYMWMDAHDMRFMPEQFELITARNAFRYFRNPQAVVTHCYNLLSSKRGYLYIIEGIPPSERTVPVYQNVFDIKGKRNIFTPNLLIDMMKRSGFTKIEKMEYVIKHNDIWEWLMTDGNLSINDRVKIMDIHRNMTGEQKKDYGYVEEDGKIYCDFMNVLLVGQK